MFSNASRCSGMSIFLGIKFFIFFGEVEELPFFLREINYGCILRSLFYKNVAYEKI